MVARFALCAACLIFPFVAASVPELPDNVVPVHYDVYVAPNLDAMSWRGEVTIAIDVKRATAVSAVAAIRRNRRIATEILPALDRWIATR